jgi:hypothetical protein
VVIDGLGLLIRGLQIKQQENNPMKIKMILAVAVTVSVAAPAMADEYYVVREPSTHKCTVVTKKPASNEEVTQIGPLAFETRQKAEERIKTVEDCD